MRRYVSSKPVTTKRIAAEVVAFSPTALAIADEQTRPAQARRRLILATLLATTALTAAAPITVFAADKIVDGVTETISTPQSFDNVTVGNTLPNSQLDIVSGGNLNASGTTVIGDQSASVGTVTISGSGSTLTSDGAIMTGYAGTGTLTISAGGAASTGSLAAIGYNAGSVGTLTVSGTASTLTATSGVGVGVLGQGALTISGGGTVSASNAVGIGFAVGATGTAAVSGVGSTLTSTSDIRVGLDGSGTLTVDGGGVASSGNSVFVGESAGAIGTVTVSGAGSQLTAAADISVGVGGHGTLVISNGGLASASANAFIGDDAGSVGSVTVSGAGSRLKAGGDLNISKSGTGALTVFSGGVAEVAGTMAIAVFSGSVGTLNIGAAAGQTAVAAGNVVGAGGAAANIQFGSGSGQIVFNHTDTALGFTANVSGNGEILSLSGGTTLSGTVNLGAGRILIDGGVVQIGGSTSADSAYIGDTAGSSGTMTVSGSGSTLTTNSLVVGFSGTGVLNVVNGGQVQNSGVLSIGNSPTGEGTVTISGSGSKLTSTSNAVVGLYGNGALNVLDGGEVNIANSPLTIAGGAAKQGTVTVSGNGSKLTADDVIVGQYGIAQVTIAAGGVVESNRRVFIGDFAGSSGTVTVSGSGAKLVASNDIFVGRFGAGTLTISGGGAVQSDRVQVGFGAGSSGAVTVSGAGSTLTAGGNVSVGNQSNGSLTVADGGAVSAGRLIIADNTDAQGTVTVSGRGSTIKMSGGSTGHLYISDGYRASATMTISSGATVETNRLFIATSARGKGELVVTGAGSKLSMSGDAFIGDGGPDSSGTVTIADGGEIVGNGIVAIGAIGVGALSVSGSGSKLTTSGAIDVGRFNSIGTLTVANGGVVEAAGTLTIARDSDSSGTMNIGAAAAMAAVGAGRVHGAGGAAANIAFGAGTGAIVFNHTAVNYVFDANVSGAGTLSQFAGVTSLTGDFNGFTGAANVSGGTLSVDTVLGRPVNLLAGGTVGGTGTVNDLIISAGGTLAPGSVASPYGTLTITNPLTFATGSFYAVRLSNGISSFTQVNSTAALGGASVNAVFGTTGAVSLQPYRILSASGGLSGTFDPLVGSNLANFKPTLSYNANDVYLSLAFTFPAGLNGNQQAVASALTKAFDATGTVPLAFGALDAQALSQAAGETAAGSQQTAFSAMNRFMTLLSDPDSGSRGAEVGPDAGGTPLAYAGAGQPADAMAAIASATKAAPLKASVFVPSWKVWAAGFGGSEITDGNAAAGTSGMTSSISGVAAGADYRLAPDWTAGFALAGGGSQFKVTGSGDGRSDLFQAGGFLRHTVGPAYVSAALAYGFQDVTTNRNVGAERLRATFSTNTVSGRIEGGWRFFTPVLGGVGVTPYAAAQVTTMLLPSYAETAVGGSNTFALAYGSKTVTDTITELGLRTDRSYVLVDGAVVTLRGRAAWAHDFNPSRSASATFQSLPLASFVVNGAAQASDAALTSASAEVAWADGWSASLSFDGAFSDITRSYAGKAALRRAW